MVTTSLDSLYKGKDKNKEWIYGKLKLIDKKIYIIPTFTDFKDLLDPDNYQVSPKIYKFMQYNDEELNPIYVGDYIIKKEYPFMFDGAINYIAEAFYDGAFKCYKMKSINPKFNLLDGVIFDFKSDDKYYVIGNKEDGYNV
jgi:hypothetical protein